MPKQTDKPQEQKPPNETDVLRTMLNTPPEPHKKVKTKKTNK